MAPKLTQHYESVIIDSRRWNDFQPREGDVVISTSYKGGTTWMQGICGTLIFQSPEAPGELDSFSPWVDAIFEPVEELLARLEEQQHRRYLKTHLPLTALPYYPQCQYIFVGRDGRDIFMSMWNHWHNFNPEVRKMINEDPNRRGPKFADPPESAGAAFNDWISKSTFPWEQDGFPFWSHHYHAQTWWEHRKLDNVLHVHFQDLLDDLDGQMRRISAFLDIPVDEEIWPALVDSMTFGEMKKNAATRAPGANKGIWKDDKNFFHKGTNRRWDGVLSAEQLERYDAVLHDLVEPSLYRWLTHSTGFLDPKTL
ncbi:MAG: sulfotransferase domain-containing protein [Pseudomonadota bacterium]